MRVQESDSYDSKQFFGMEKGKKVTSETEKFEFLKEFDKINWLCFRIIIQKLGKVDVFAKGVIKKNSLTTYDLNYHENLKF